MQCTEGNNNNMKVQSMAARFPMLQGSCVPDCQIQGDNYSQYYLAKLK